MEKKSVVRAVRTELTSKGSRRVNQILGAASAVLFERGFRAVNKRSVANRLGISDGNVSYYFPTTESLWMTVIDHEIAEYYRRHHAVSIIEETDAQEVFDDYVGRWIDEYQDPKVRIFFSQLISVAESNAHIASKRDDIYKEFEKTILVLARRLEPEIEPAELETRVLTIIAVLEGLHAVSAFRPALFSENPQYKIRTISLVNMIVRGKAP